MSPESCELLCLDTHEAETIRARRVAPEALEGPARIGKALSDPTRLLVLDALAKGGELCVCDLSWIAERSQALTSHHVRTLREAGLVSSRRVGKMVLYTVTEGTSELVATLLSTSGAEAIA